MFLARFIAASVAMLSSAAASSAQELFVPGDYATIQEALAAR